MHLSQQFSIRNQQVINETLDNETIIINLETGVYYSLNPMGTLIWKAINAKLSFGLISNQLMGKYPEAVEIEGIVEKYIAFLELEQLVEKIDFCETNLRDFEVILQSELSSYVPPAIEKYEDMQEMLLADPIHEVEEDGWPKLKK
jgi:hypothetical protein